MLSTIILIVILFIITSLYVLTPLSNYAKTYVECCELNSSTSQCSFISDGTVCSDYKTFKSYTETYISSNNSTSLSLIIFSCFFHIFYIASIYNSMNKRGLLTNEEPDYNLPTVAEIPDY